MKLANVHVNYMAVIAIIAFINLLIIGYVANVGGTRYIFHEAIAVTSDQSVDAILMKLSNDPVTKSLGGVIWPLWTRTSPSMRVACYASDGIICPLLEHSGRWETFDAIDKARKHHFPTNADRYTFLDLGANIGMFSLYLASQPNWSGVAVEPMFGEILDFNLMANGRQDDVKVVRAAVGEHNGTIKMHVNRKNPGGSFAGEFGTNVHMITINELMTDLGVDHFDYVKIDIEGYEYQALKSASKLLDGKKAKMIQFEFRHENMERSKVSPLDLLTLFTKYGYKIYKDLDKLIEVTDFANFAKINHYGDLFAF